MTVRIAVFSRTPFLRSTDVLPCSEATECDGGSGWNLGGSHDDPTSQLTNEEIQASVYHMYVEQIAYYYSKCTIVIYTPQTAVRDDHIQSVVKFRFSSHFVMVRKPAKWLILGYFTALKKHNFSNAADNTVELSFVVSSVVVP